MINSGTFYTTDTTVAARTIVESPAEIRNNITVEITSSGELIIRSVTVATVNSDIEIYSP